MTSEHGRSVKCHISMGGVFTFWAWEECSWRGRRCTSPPHDWPEPAESLSQPEPRAWAWAGSWWTPVGSVQWEIPQPPPLLVFCRRCAGNPALAPWPGNKGGSTAPPALPHGIATDVWELGLSPKIEKLSVITLITFLFFCPVRIKLTTF
jgi:hypothetical protein